MAKVISVPLQKAKPLGIRHYTFVVMLFLLVLLGLLLISNGVKAEGQDSQLMSTRITAVKPTAAPISLSLNEPETPTSYLSHVFTPTVLRWEKQITEAALRYDFDPNLLAIIVQIESCGDPQAVSHAGAVGLGQVMPYHFAAGENPYDPVTNLNRAALYYYNGLRSSNYDIGLSFAGYNGGHGTVQKGYAYWKSETVRYHKWATGIFWDIKMGLEESPTINEWLGRGGHSLCQQAASR